MVEEDLAVVVEKAVVPVAGVVAALRRVALHANEDVADDESAVPDDVGDGEAVPARTLP